MERARDKLLTLKPHNEWHISVNGTLNGLV